MPYINEIALPCPFCGSKNISYEFSCSQGFMMCLDCHAEGPKDEEAADPICSIDVACDAWNRRVKKPDLEGI